MVSTELRRPWLYLLVATGVLYVIYGFTFLFLADSITGPFSIALGDEGQVTRSVLTGLPLQTTYIAYGYGWLVR